MADLLPLYGPLEALSKDNGTIVQGVTRKFKLGAEARLKAEIAQDPEVILGNPLLGRTDEPHPPRRQIGKAAGVDDADEFQRIADARGAVRRETRTACQPEREMTAGGVAEGGDAGEVDRARALWRDVTGWGLAAQYWSDESGAWVKKQERAAPV